MIFSDDLNLTIYLATDTQISIDRLSNSHLQKWGVDTKSAFEVAFQNLLKNTFEEKITYQSDIQVAFYETKDGYDATRIVLSQTRNWFCKKLGVKECYIGIPNRDFLVAFVPTPNMTVEVHHEKINNFFLNHRYKVSDHIFGANVKGELWIVK